MRARTSGTSLPARIPTSRSLVYRAKRLARIAYLRLAIWIDEDWLRETDPDGVLTTAVNNAARLRLLELHRQLADAINS